MQQTLHQQGSKRITTSTVKHHLECKKLWKKSRRLPHEAETKQYRKNLFEITHFRAPEYRPRSWISEKQRRFLESLGTLQDPRMKKRTATLQVQRRRLRRLESSLNCLDVSSNKISKKTTNRKKIKIWRRSQRSNHTR